jgi:hypothetical protein
MKAYRYLYILFALALVACVSNPVDTLNKRFAVFETGYNSALTQIDRIQKANAFKPETANKVADALIEVNRARKVANVARYSGDVLDANNALDIAMRALEKLQSEIPAGTKI